MTAPAAAEKTKSPTTPDTAAGDDSFIWRHLGPRPADVTAMLQSLGYSSLEELTAATVPASIRLKSPLNIGPPQSEFQTLAQLRALANQNKVYRSFIGMGYYGTITPPVIQRNILENPGWYTQYTPYQAEISQGRLEALLNFQTMVADLTALPMANASLLDEATAAAEAMAMCHSITDTGDESAPKKTFFISQHCHPQTIAVVQARAQALGIPTQVADEQTLLGPHSVLDTYSGILVQYPTTDGRILDYSLLTDAVHAQHALLVAATDLLALTLITPPGEWGRGENRGADIAIGSAQRFGVPMGYGGPHAAFMATKPQYVRKMPGRIVGVSKDAAGNPAYRLALQTREQHIRREKATSNICTAQVLLAIMASMYAVYHGPEGLKAIAQRVHNLTRKLASMLAAEGHQIVHDEYFDTLRIQWNPPEGNGKVLQNHAGTYRHIIKKAQDAGLNFNAFNAYNNEITLSLDETASEEDLALIVKAFSHDAATTGKKPPILSAQLKIENRKSKILQHPTFNSYHSEHEMLRYIKRLESRDLSLCQSMIPLGSCTMKLNATAEMFPITWPEFAHLHPFAPLDQTQGYQKLFKDLEQWLANITGFAAVSLQPNAGSQGEYAGLLVIRAYHESQAKTQNAKLKTQNQNPEPGTRNPEPAPRDICLIPTSAHGTNPASAVVAGLKVIPVECDSQGNIDVADLRAKAAEHRDHLSCIMVTYPSTHGVFEESIREICQIVHDHGGQVYMDGANMNAQVGLTSPGEIGADVCHLNLHKTFCIPHGGGGPGMGPICVAKHLAPYLPTHPVTPPIPNTPDPIPPVSAAPWGSAAILPIPYAYIAMMGSRGLTMATQVAILNANYMAKRLEGHYPVVFKGKNGRCAHEFIIDCRHFEASAGVKVEDIAKRLMDYGFHAPTMSWPEPGTLMIEPTESESKQELDRLCDALISIRQEIRDLEEGRGDKKDNVLKNAPHTVHTISKDTWPHPYSRQVAAFPVPGLLQYKFWPPVSRIDNPYGDRNLFCSCPPLNP